MAAAGLVAAKQREIDLLSANNDELRACLSELEIALEDMAAIVAKKDVELGSLRRQLDASEHQVLQLKGLQHRMDGNKEAIESAVSQNRSVLIALQQTDEKLRSAVEDNSYLKAEIQSSLRDKRVAWSVGQAERFKSALKSADDEISAATQARLEYKRRAELAEKNEASARRQIHAELQLARENAERHKKDGQVLSAKLRSRNEEFQVVEKECREQKAYADACYRHSELLKAQLSEACDRERLSNTRLAEKSAHLDTARASAAASGARLLIEERRSSELEAALADVVRSRNHEVTIKQRLSRQVEIALAATAASRADEDRLRARIKHERVARNLDRKEAQRLATKLGRAYRLLQRKQLTIQEQLKVSTFRDSPTSPSQNKRKKLPEVK